MNENKSKNIPIFHTRRSCAIAVALFVKSLKNRAYETHTPESVVFTSSYDAIDRELDGTVFLHYGMAMNCTLSY